MANKDLSYYMALPYTVQFKQTQDDEGPYFVAKILEIEGLVAGGKTVEEAHRALREEMRKYFEVRLEHGDPIPEPVPDEKEFSGKFNLRLPKSLHKKLSELAEAEGVSLNQYILYKLSSLLGG